MNERDWQRLVEQIRNGDCTPFLGAATNVGTQPMGFELSRHWARRYDYPFDNETTLPDVMQYATIIERDPTTVKARAAMELSSFGEPDFTNPSEIHSLLARCPVSVYLTTNYDDFMTQALLRAGKEPVTAVCPWYSGARPIDREPLPSSYEPNPEQPLVYHLHGRLDDPSSLVLTEEDYLEFTVNLAKDLGGHGRRMVPIQVLAALSRRPLLFLGYSLRDWSFRVLYHGFVRSVADVQRRRHLCVQLPPYVGSDAKSTTRARDYLDHYYEKLNVSVFWGSLSEFSDELDRRLVVS